MYVEEKTRMKINNIETKSLSETKLQSFGSKCLRKAQLPCLVPLLVHNPWHVGQVGLWHANCFCLPVVQHLWHVPLHQDLCSLREVLERDDVVVAHVEGIGVALGHMLLQLLVRKSKQLEDGVWGRRGGC